MDTATSGTTVRVAHVLIPGPGSTPVLVGLILLGRSGMVVLSEIGRLRIGGQVSRVPDGVGQP